MTIEIDLGFKKLEKVADFQGDKEKANRVKEKLGEVKEFLGEEGLLIEKPHKLINEAKEKEGDIKRIGYQEHLSAVAEEALQIEDGNFKYSKKSDIIKALRNKMAQGSDPRLISTYTNSTLSYHIFEAGINLGGGLNWNEYRPQLEGSLVSLVASKDFSKIIPFEGWRQTLKYVSKVFPKNTKAFNVWECLVSFPKNKGNSVAERINELHKEG